MTDLRLSELSEEERPAGLRARAMFWRCYVAACAVAIIGAVIWGLA